MLGTYYPCSRAVFAGREHGCHFGLDTREHRPSRSAGAIVNDVIIIFYLSKMSPVFTPHGPWTRPREHGEYELAFSWNSYCIFPLFSVLFPPSSSRAGSWTVNNEQEIIIKQSRPCFAAQVLNKTGQLLALQLSKNPTARLLQFHQIIFRT